MQNGGTSKLVECHTHFQIKLLTVEISLWTLVHDINRAQYTATHSFLGVITTHIMHIRCPLPLVLPLGGRLWSVGLDLKSNPAERPNRAAPQQLPIKCGYVQLWSFPMYTAAAANQFKPIKPKPRQAVATAAAVLISVGGDRYRYTPSYTATLFFPIVYIFGGSDQHNYTSVSISEIRSNMPILKRYTQNVCDAVC